MTNKKYIGTPTNITDSLTPVVGYKAASLLMHLKTKYASVLPAHFSNQSFEFSDRCQCRKAARKRHDFLACSCGFYAYKDLADASHHRHIQQGTLVFEVALSGAVVTAENGYKAERQRVTRIYANNCKYCPEEAYCFALPEIVKSPFERLTTVCFAHALHLDLSQRIMFEEIAQKASYEGYPPVEIAPNKNSLPYYPEGSY